MGTALIAALAAIVAALGTQLVRARADLKMKKLDLYFARKADAYLALCAAIGAFALHPSDKGQYVDFLAALEGASLLASAEAKEEIDALSREAQPLRTTSEEARGDPGTFRQWGPQVKKAIAAMRADLDRFGGTD